jgi:hypothetical protein
MYTTKLFDVGNGLQGKIKSDFQGVKKSLTKTPLRTSLSTFIKSGVFSTASPVFRRPLFLCIGRFSPRYF